MPTLDWIGKQAVVNHHQHVPYRLVHCNGDLSAGDPDSGNLVVQGDNLEALKALLPYYAGKVKLIYIDPPYNTGNEGWVYNDNVNSPQIQKWLGDPVGKEAENLSRHDKWLSMMYPRLRLLREFLREDGVIFISIDDDENHRLRLLLDEIYGAQNFVASLIWQKKYAPANDAKYFSDDHDYVLVYARQKALWRPNKLARTDEQNARDSNADNDPRGLWKTSDYSSNKNRLERPNGWYAITNSNTGVEVWPAETRVWAYPKETSDRHLADNRLQWGQRGTNRVPAYKRFLSEVGGVVPRTVMLHGDVGHNQTAKRQILEIFHQQSEVFSTPKPSSLIQRFIEIGSNPGDLILDSFAGSGTTGHAVLQANKDDGGNRRFILAEMEEDIARKVTAERLTRVINGYDKTNGKKEHVEGLDGGFRFCTLGRPLFDEYGGVDPEVKVTSLAAHVFFVETGSPIPKRANGKTPLLGIFENRAVYLLFHSQSAGFAQEEVGNVLTPSLLDNLPLPAPDFEGIKIIYGEGCMIDDARLERENIIFKQIPYSIGG